MFAIYEVVNLLNGKTYIGQMKYNTSVEERKDYYGSGIAIKGAIAKYGIQHFKKYILYERIQYKRTADSMEKYAIKIARSSSRAQYNISPGGTGGDLHQFWTEAGKQKLREANRNKRLNEEQKEHCRLGQARRWSKPDSRNSCRKKGWKRKVSSTEVWKKSLEAKEGWYKPKQVSYRGIVYPTLREFTRSTGISGYKVRRYARLENTTYYMEG